jgi:hypothetical protein
MMLRLILVFAFCAVSGAASAQSCGSLQSSIPQCTDQSNTCNSGNSADRDSCKLRAAQSYKQCMSSRQAVLDAYRTCAQAQSGKGGRR